jgi:hypothetical protein
MPFLGDFVLVFVGVVVVDDDWPGDGRLVTHDPEGMFFPLYRRIKSILSTPLSMVMALDIMYTVPSAFTSFTASCQLYNKFRYTPIYRLAAAHMLFSFCW